MKLEFSQKALLFSDTYYEALKKAKLTQPLGDRPEVKMTTDIELEEALSSSGVTELDIRISNTGFKIEPTEGDYPFMLCVTLNRDQMVHLHKHLEAILINDKNRQE